MRMTLMPLASGGRSALTLGFGDAEYQLGYADVGAGATTLRSSSCSGLRLPKVLTGTPVGNCAFITVFITCRRHLCRFMP